MIEAMREIMDSTFGDGEMGIACTRVLVREVNQQGVSPDFPESFLGLGQ